MTPPIFYCSIEGIPLITRFKTKCSRRCSYIIWSIEGIPLITRFKTSDTDVKMEHHVEVLKVFHL